MGRVQTSCVTPGQCFTFSADASCQIQALIIGLASLYLIFKILVQSNVITPQMVIMVIIWLKMASEKHIFCEKFPQHQSAASYL